MQNFGRALIAATALLAFAGAASADDSYIVEVGPQHTSRSSIEFVTCASCAPVEAEQEALRFQAFNEGMVSEIRMIDGERKVVRTDNMWGGSPVTTIVSAGLVFGDLIPANFAEHDVETPVTASAGMVAAAPLIDRAAVTSSLEETAQPASLQDLELRLN